MSKITVANRILETAFGIKEGEIGVDPSYEDDQHKGVIRGFAVITKGFIKDDRGWEIDDVTLERTVTAGNKLKNGHKSRFGHPNISSTALGTFIGRAKNFRKDGDIVRADLYLNKTAYGKTLKDNLAQYVLDLAESDPEAFGASIVLKDYDLEYAVEKNGARKRNEDGKELPPMLRVNSLFGVDVVDEPAANDGMLSKFFNASVELSAKATEFLNKLLDNPDALEYVIAFLERYRVNRVDIDEDEEIGQVLDKKEEGMEIKDLTVEQLKKERPDVVSSLQSEIVKEERSRCLTIVKTANKEFSGMGMEAIVEESIENGKTMDASLAVMRGKRLEDLKQNANKAPGADKGDPEKKKSHLEIAKEYQREHKCSLQEALSLTAEPREN